MTRVGLSVAGFDVERSESMEDLMRIAHLDWEVQPEALATESGRAVPSHKALVREDTGSVVGVVGARYQPIQNRRVFEVLSELVDDGDARFTQAGSTHGGRRIFAVMALSKGWTLENDPHVGQLLATTTHDGTGALHIRPLITRLACTNQINGLFWRKRHANGVTIPHRAAASERVQGLRSALGLSLAAVDEYEGLMRTMLDMPVTEGDVEAFLKQLFPDAVKDLPRAHVAQERAEASRSAVVEAYRSDRGEAIQGTAFGLMQAAFDWSDWASPVRAKDADMRRAERIITGGDSAFKQRAFDLAMAR